MITSSARDLASLPLFLELQAATCDNLAAQELDAGAYGEHVRGTLKGQAEAYRHCASLLNTILNGDEAPDEPVEVYEFELHDGRTIRGEIVRELRTTSSVGMTHVFELSVEGATMAIRREEIKHYWQVAS